MFGNNIVGPLGVRNSLSLPKILNGISKTLGVVNQAIPLYQQAKPMISKGRTLFKLATEISKPEKKEKEPVKSSLNSNLNINNTTIPKRNIPKNMPVFFQ